MDAPKKRSRLAESAYDSPYSRSGAPGPHPNTDPYASLRSRALSTLAAMGYNPETMTERGILWAEDQDPYGHVMQSQYMHLLGSCFHRIVENYSEYLDEDEYEGMIKGTAIVPVLRKYELEIRRQVTYPDSLIAANKQDFIEPTRSWGTTCLFSLKQQAIVAEVKGAAVFIDVKTARPVDIRTIGPGWRRVYDWYVRECERSRELKEKWEKEKKEKATKTAIARRTKL